MTIINNKLSILLALGVHIGDISYASNYFSEINFFLLCLRHEFHIFNWNKLLFFLKRAMYYIAVTAQFFTKLLFFHSSLYNCYNLKFILTYIIKHKGKHSVISNYWFKGLLSNYKDCFKKLLDILLKIDGRLLKKKKEYKLKNTFFKYYNSIFLRYAFLKILYLTCDKTKLQRDWASEFHKLWLYWRIYIFLRSFSHIFNLPDILILINPSNCFYTAFEFSKTYKLPVISTIDSSSAWFGVTYPIPSNDDSLPLNFFFFSVFVNVYLNSKLEQYKSF